MARVKCYIKGEESNAEKKAGDTKERGNTNSDRRNYYLPPTTQETEEPSKDRTEYLTVWTTLPH